MATTITRTRTATPARWQKALTRAIESGIRVYRIAGTGEAVVTSQRDHETVYRTDGITCDCAAGTLANDPVCAHRAVYWFERGILELDPEPEPPVPAAPAVESETLRQAAAWLAVAIERGDAAEIAEAHAAVATYREAAGCPAAAPLAVVSIVPAAVAVAA